jgi:MoaA/NifB/PqqE/SkfB family radical SAM enzyme
MISHIKKPPIQLKISRKLRKVGRITRGIYQYNISHNFKPLTPTTVLIGLTYHCNSQCVMCNIWKTRPKDELKYEEWEEIFKDSAFDNIERCDLTGGEVSLYPKLPKMVKLITNSMPKLRKLTMVSHGFMTKKIVKQVVKIAKICNQHGVELSVSISLDGVGKMHEKIRRIPNAFKKTTATLFELKKLSKKYGFWVGSGSLILKQNLPEVGKMKKWYKDNQINGTFQIVGFHNTYVNNLNTKKEVNFRKEELKQLTSFMKELSQPKSWNDFRAYYWNDLFHMYRYGQPRTTPCPFQYDQFAMDSFGDVYYCFSERKIGNCRHGKSVSKILSSSKNLKFRQKMTKSSCLGCNSGCDVERSVPRELKKYLWFRLTGKPWYGLNKIFKQPTNS